MKLSHKDIELLQLIEKDANLSVSTLAKMLNVPEDEIQEKLDLFVKENIIVQYTALVNWSKVKEHNGVTAIIEVKVTPKRGVGFDEIAERIYKYPEVQSLYLMSGSYDLAVTVEGKSMNEVASFVSDRLSTLDSVLSTTTHFQLKKYKHDGTIFEDRDDDHRMVVTP
ncbi:AsnC family transcriptional regulator [Bacillus coahuilensis m2-6]|uniref:AsnC family transcriptional regulator n=1 Tax=Bacillus coahuilensis p1.1.43 TaxID=1150625 RepID=A0A147K6C7_9BACI|nr:Lrp/AsnC family transcriptional regulator [Bacillus coahuilensis]KUP05337.1 AsnC family transcriptional regulator [Bacillus coahuilensis p1.1.43]KUP06080.1 AsnC family transcriptional regulator [Bacillus coahuilensis m2-6]